jgi:hypothetical protein
MIKDHLVDTFQMIFGLDTQRMEQFELYQHEYFDYVYTPLARECNLEHSSGIYERY